MNEYMRRCEDAMLLAQSDGCSVYQFRNETGEGTITVYDVYPGVMLSFNDFHMNYYDSVFVPDSSLFSVDHCREGRMECPAGVDLYSYVEAGDLKLDRRLSHKGRFEMPLKHYHGVTVTFDLNRAPKSLQESMPDFSFDLHALQEKFCAGIYPVVIHRDRSIEHVFSELYSVPLKIRRNYFKIKIMELLLYLDALEIPKSDIDRPYFYRNHVEKVKAIHDFLAEHMDENHTQEELSARFDIPLTSMKQCFKSVYGSTIASWLLKYRMNHAAVQLKCHREISIAEIAGQVGYDSPSKFAIAFRKVMGMSPTEYRGKPRDKEVLIDE